MADDDLIRRGDVLTALRETWPEAVRPLVEENERLREVLERIARYEGTPPDEGDRDYFARLARSALSSSHISLPQSPEETP